MAKKGLGKFVMLAAAAGAAAAGISYFRKYHSFNKELDEDFHDFEDEEDTPVPDSTMTRNYVSLHADKDEFLVAAGDMLNAAKDVAGAAKNVMKDAAAIVADTTREAMGAAADTASRFSFGNSDEEDIFEDEDTVPSPSVKEAPKADAAPLNEETPEEAAGPDAEKEEEGTPQDTVSVSIDTEAALAEDGEEIME